MNYRISLNIRKIVKRVDIVSAIGKLYHTPSDPSHKGSMYSSGRRKRSCLDNERIMDLFTIPRHWKKFVDIIWNPTIGKTIVMILNAFDPSAISSSSCVNIPTAVLEKNIPKMKHKVVITIASFAVFQNTSFTLEYWRAP